MPSEQPEFKDWFDYQKKVQGNAFSYPADGFVQSADLPDLPVIAKDWKDTEERAVYNANKRAQRDLVIGFSNKEFLKSRMHNRLTSFQLLRKRARLVAQDGGILDRLRNTLNEVIKEGS